MHCCAQALAWLELARLLEEERDDMLLGTTELLTELLEDDEGWLEEERDDDTLEVVPPQILPVTAGVSTLPLALTCNPKETVCPGWIPAFQPRLVAE